MYLLNMLDIYTDNISIFNYLLYYFREAVANWELHQKSSNIWDSHLINILTSRLPGNVTRPIYLEYDSRRREIDRIWANAENHYQMLQSYVSTVEALLAISIFYRHVMGHMQGAVSFYKSVNRNFGMMNECAIKVGKIVLDNKQQKHLFSAVIKLYRFT